MNHPIEYSSDALHAIEGAEHRLVSNVELLSGWLRRQCQGKPNVPTVYVPRDLSVLVERMDTMGVPQLLSLAMYQRPEASGLAMLRLREQFVEAHPQLLARYAQEAKVAA